MSKPVVALVGRPNVGKSTLFNRLAKKKLAIVEDIPGVTRDRHYTDAMFSERAVLLVDTGGFEPRTDDDMLLAMRQQTELAIEEADAVILVTDAAQGLRPEDKEIARRLRKAQKPFLVCANKIDHDKHEASLYEFHQVGGEQVLPVSAEHNRGVVELVEAAVKMLPEAVEEPADPDVRAHLAVVGRPNAGKSSLVNRLLGNDRHLATPIAGTTRDSIDSLVEQDGKRYCFIDTAGLRRKARISERLEEYMVVSALRSLDRADIAVLVLDAQELGADQDSKIAALAHERGKGIVLAINKWDLPHERLTAKTLRDEIDRHFPFLGYARLVYLSAKTGQGIDGLWQAIEATLVEREKRIPTGELNRMMEDLYDQHQPVVRGGKRGKIYFSAQVSVSPPTFVLHVNDPDRFGDGYTRYLQNALRKRYGFEGTPIVVHFRRRHKEVPGSEAVKEKVAAAKSQRIAERVARAKSEQRKTTGAKANERKGGRAVAKGGRAAKRVRPTRSGR